MNNNRKSLAYAEEQNTFNYAILLRDGRTILAKRFAGGGMVIGGAGYEVSFIDRRGSLKDIYQKEIAAVFDLDKKEQVEFGNPYIEGHISTTK